MNANTNLVAAPNGYGYVPTTTAPSTEEALRRADAHRNQGRLDGAAQALADLQAAKEEADAKLARAESIIMDLRHRVEDLRGDIETLDAAHEQATAELERAQIHCETLERENRALRANVSALSDKEMKAAMYAAAMRREAQERERQERLEAQQEWDTMANLILTQWITPKLGECLLERDFFNETTNLLREAHLEDVRNSDVRRWLNQRAVFLRGKLAGRRTITVKSLKEDQ